jgi:hypothetical protein
MFLGSFDNSSMGKLPQELMDKMSSHTLALTSTYQHTEIVTHT